MESSSSPNVSYETEGEEDGSSQMEGTRRAVHRHSFDQHHHTAHHHNVTEGSVVCDMALADAQPLLGPLDGTRIWVPMFTAAGRATLGQLSGKRVRLRFALVRADLYSFWLTHDRRGRSGGYLGGGAFGSQHIIDH